MKQYKRKYDEDYITEEYFIITIKRDNKEVNNGLSTVTVEFKSEGKNKLLVSAIKVPYSKITELMFNLKNKLK